MSHSEYVTRMAMVALCVWGSVYLMFYPETATSPKALWIELISSAVLAILAAIIYTT